jgi:hypothetical protein
VVDRKLSEFVTDPFFEFFNATHYVAVPIKFGRRVMAVLAAVGSSETEQDSLDEISLIYGLSQQASAAAQHIMNQSDHRRRLRILAKIDQALNDADSASKFEEATKLGLVMFSRAVGASGCFLKDLTRQKTFHIKSVSEYSPDADTDDLAIAGSFDEVLDRCAGRIEPISGNSAHALLTGSSTQAVRYFYAHPLVAGGDVVGAMAVYTEHKDSESARDYGAEDKNFLKLCAGVLADKINVRQKDGRIARAEDFLKEVSSNLARERERSRIGDRSIDYHGQITEDLDAAQKLLSSKEAYSKRFPAVAGIIKSMRQYSADYKKEVLTKETRYEMTRLFTLARTIVEEWRDRAVEKGIKVSARIPARGPALLLDRKRVETALRNVLDTTLGCLQKDNKVLIECSATRDQVTICVADNGKGLPGDAVSRLFMPFGPTDDMDEQKRALSVAGEVIQKHAGEIMVKSTVSWKTILILTFPTAANRDRRKTGRDRRRRSRRRTPVESS